MKAEHVHALAALLGFVVFETGIAMRSTSIAAIVGGLLLMLGGSWRYLLPMVRVKR